MLNANDVLAGVCSKEAIEAVRREGELRGLKSLPCYRRRCQRFLGGRDEP
jgi:hypothetical protein